VSVADPGRTDHDADTATSRRARLIHGVAEGLHAGGRVLVRVLPRGILRAVEDRVFYAIFQKTRVENDAYGWRPPPPGA
jgi:hypothetical protein